MKYSKTIMDLWRRVIVFIILRLTNAEGKITVKRRDGMEQDGKDEGRRPRKKQASKREETRPREEVVEKRSM